MKVVEHRTAVVAETTCEGTASLPTTTANTRRCWNGSPTPPNMRQRELNRSGRWRRVRPGFFLLDRIA